MRPQAKMNVQHGKSGPDLEMAPVERGDGDHRPFGQFVLLRVVPDSPGTAEDVQKVTVVADLRNPLVPGAAMKHRDE